MCPCFIFRTSPGGSVADTNSTHVPSEPDYEEIAYAKTADGGYLDTLTSNTASHPYIVPIQFPNRKGTLPSQMADTCEPGYSFSS